ncbi:MAG: tetratricopeptide repeat protein [Sedimenticolaceae bacterium]
MPSRRSQNTRQTQEQIARTRRSHIIWLSVLVVAVFAASLGGDFVWTDREDILQGGHRVTALADIPTSLVNTRPAYQARLTGGQADGSAGSWQPLTLLSNSVSWTLWGDCAACFHLENVLLHLVVVVGLYALGRHLLSRRRHANRLAFWSAALYAVHPATVNSVAWIGGRPYLLAAAFGVWSLVVFTRLQATTNAHRGHVKRWLGGMTLMALAAMLAHETAYMLPLMALLIAGFESKERGRRAVGGIAPSRVAGLTLLLAVLLLIIIYRALVLGGLNFAADYPTDSIFNNAGTALRHLWFLIDETLLPYEPIVSDAWPITRGWGAVEVAALLGFVVLIAATLIGLKLRQPAAFGAAWFLLWLVPGVGIFPSDHYHSGHTLYLAAWGLSFAVAHALFLLWRPVGRQLVPGSEAVVFVPVILLLGILSGSSSMRWWDHSRLFESEIASDPHYMEGRLELAKAAVEKGDASVALNHSLAAIDASRDKQYTGYWSARDAFFVLGRAQLGLGMKHDAVGSFGAALDARPGDARVLYWAGVAQIALEDYAAAENHLRQALAAVPAFPEAQAELGVALAGQGRFAEAEPLLQQAIERGMGSSTRHAALALALIDADRLVEATEQLEASLALHEDADERARLAWVRWRLGHSDKAQSDLNMALLMEETNSPYVDWVRTQLQQPAPVPAKERP